MVGPHSISKPLRAPTYRLKSNKNQQVMRKADEQLYAPQEGGPLGLEYKDITTTLTDGRGLYAAPSHSGHHQERAKTP
jgi:hypothetical protein